MDNLITEFDFNLSGTLYSSPMPFSQFDPLGEVWNAYQEGGVDVVTVLVEPQEYLVHARRDLPDFYRSAGLEVYDLPIPDYAQPPNLSAFNTVIEKTENAIREGSIVAVHCLAGIGRTGTFVACLAKRVLDLSGDAAVVWVRQRIPGALESVAQEQFAKNYKF